VRDAAFSAPELAPALGAFAITCAVNFEEAIEAGELDRARVILSAYVELPDTGGFGVSEGYYQLATALDRAGRRDEAIWAHMDEGVSRGSVDLPRVRWGGGMGGVGGSRGGTS